MHPRRYDAWRTTTDAARAPVAATNNETGAPCRDRSVAPRDRGLRGAGRLPAHPARDAKGRPVQADKTTGHRPSARRGHPRIRTVSSGFRGGGPVRSTRIRGRRHRAPPPDGRLPPYDMTSLRDRAARGTTAAPVQMTAAMAPWHGRPRSAEA